MTEAHQLLVCFSSRKPLRMVFNSILILRISKKGIVTWWNKKIEQYIIEIRGVDCEI